MNIVDVLLNNIGHIMPDAVAMRRYIHAHPELSGEETQTMEYICHIFDESRIRYTVLDDMAGVVAEVGYGDCAVGIRAELDALPINEETNLPYASENAGVMHACGHDMHLSAAVAFLKLLKQYEDSLPFRVRLFAQPAEETVGGAEQMIKLGCLDTPEVKRVFGFHVDPTLPTGSVALLPGVMNAAVTDFELTVRGRSCHGAHPEQGIDAIVAAAGVINALQSVPSRRFAPTDPVIVTVGTVSGGTAGNIIAGEVKMSGTLRALDSGVMEKLRQDVRDTCEGVARGYSATAELVYTSTYPPLYSDVTLTEELFLRIETKLPHLTVQKIKAPSLGADDFAFFCEKVPSCYFNVGCRSSDAKDDQVLHCATLAPDEDALRVALETLCLILI